MENYIETIDSYFNGELTPAEESLMFSGIAQDDKAKEYFKKMNLLKAGVESSKEKLPVKVEQKILNNILERQQTGGIKFKINIQTAITYALSVAFLVLALLFYSLARDYKNELKDAKSAIEYQQTTIRALLHSLPPVNVSAKLPNEVIINNKL